MSYQITQPIPTAGWGDVAISAIKTPVGLVASAAAVYLLFFRSKRRHW